MKLPTTYDDDILGYEDGLYPDGSPVGSKVYSLVFPPIGFFPFYGIGNGDYHGFYWPIGQEEAPPIVAFSSHDAWSLIPEHSNVEMLYACELARTDDDEDRHDHYRELVTKATGKSPIDHDLRGVSSDDYDRLLSLDPDSPYYLCAAGDVVLSQNNVEAAEQKYRESLDRLPEYVAAHFGLACVLRRQRRPEEATIHLREALIGPLAFYGGSFWSDTSLPGKFRNDWNRKAVLWLQQSKTLHESLVDDPFAKRINELTFETGLAENPDLDVLQQIVEEYATAGAYSDATRIWNLIGGRAAMETTSFRERYNLNPLTFGNRLAELFQLAGNNLRATLVRNMLNAMEKPEGRHL